MGEQPKSVFGQIHEENIFVTIVKNDLIMEVNEYNMVFSFSFSLNMLFSINLGWEKKGGRKRNKS